MMRWQNCVVFETPQAFNNTVQTRGAYCYFESFTMEQPKVFPAFYYLETDAYEPYWKPCSKDFVLNRWEQATQGFLDMIAELKNGY